MSAQKPDEPTAAVSILLYIRQLQSVTDEANRRGVNRQVVIRELVDKGMEAQAQEAAEVEVAA